MRVSFKVINLLTFWQTMKIYLPIVVKIMNRCDIRLSSLIECRQRAYQTLLKQDVYLFSCHMMGFHSMLHIISYFKFCAKVQHFWSVLVVQF